MAATKAPYGAEERYNLRRGMGLGLPLLALEEEILLAVMAGQVTATLLGRELGRPESTINTYLYHVRIKAGALNLAHLVLMVAGIAPTPATLLPVQRRWRRRHYQLDEPGTAHSQTDEHTRARP